MEPIGEVVWTGAAGWLLAGLPTRGHLLTPSEVPIPPAVPMFEGPRAVIDDGLIKDRILRTLADGPLTVVELSRRLRVALGTVQTTVSRLRKAGRVVKGANKAPVRLV